MSDRIGDLKQVSASFCLEIEYDRESENPGRVFKTMAAMIESLEALDRDLAVSIHSKIQPILLLEDVQAGSIRTWLISMIRDLDDEALKSGEFKRVVGTYLVKAKWCIIDFLQEKTKVTHQAEIDGLQRQLLQLAEETNVMRLPSYVPIERTRLLKGIQGITDSLSHLGKKDKAAYYVGDRKTSFNLSFEYSVEEIEALITKESIQSDAGMILKVKKPDYLGDSMWEFRHGKLAVYAKILDEEWLSDFQQRRKDVRPGDSLRVRVRQISNYDYDHNLISVKYEVTKVLDVLLLERFDQTDAFEV